ncbi:MAG: DNA-formamidopyrimidine glycosylase family protein [Rhodanobacter sp.]
MPELPEIETFKRYLDATSLRQKIARVTVTKQRILEGVSSRQLASALKNHSFRDSERHGKYLAIGLDDGRQLVLHFGMTGCLHYVEEAEPDSRHARMIITFDNGHRLDYDNKRMLGRVRLVKDFEHLVEQLDLGPDALELSLACFDERLHGHGGAIKSTLMNQSIVAGLGNTYTDEILFQARIHPATPVDALSEAERKTVYRMMLKVLHKAIAVKADPERLPRSYLVPHRRAGARCPRGNGTIRQTRVAGRSAYFCPACQPRRKRSR